MNPKVQDLIDQIKERAAGLEYTEDGFAFDKYVGELDLLLYELRTVAWHSPKPSQGEQAYREIFGETVIERETRRALERLPEGVKAYRMNHMDQWLDELAEELNDEQRRSKTKDANRN